MRYVWFFVLGLFGTFFFVSKVSALSLNPSILEIAVAPSEEVIQAIEITNTQEVPVTVSLVGIRPFAGNGESGEVSFAVPPEEEDAVQWFTIPKKSLVLAPGARGEYLFRIAVPAFATPGDHPVALLLQEEPSISSPSAHVRTSSQIGVLLFIRVSGAIEEKMQIETFSSARKWYVDPPIHLMVRLQNDGNVILKPKGSVVLRTLFGTIKKEIPINTEGKRILAHSVRRFEIVLGEEPGTGWLHALRQELHFFALGAYTAEVQVAYAAEVPPLLERISFWVIPWRSITLVIIFLVLIILVARYLRVRRTHA